MTDLRALDDVQPPDLWPEIVDRAAAPAARPPERRSNRLLLAAAVLIVLAGLVGGLVVTQLGGDDAVTEEPASLWGRRWELRSITRDGTAVDLTDVSANLDLRREGEVGFRACNTVGGAVRLVDGRLEPGGPMGGTDEGCVGPGADADDAFRRLIEESPTVELSDDRLVLRSATVEAVFVPMAVAEDAFWGHVWNLDQLSVDEERVEVPDGVEGTIIRAGSTAPYLDTTQVGSVGYGGCGGGGLEAHLEGERLVADSGWGQEEPACDQLLMDVDDLIEALLVSEPVVEVDGDRLTILGGGTLAAFTDAEVDGPVLVWPGFGSCSAGLEGGPILLPGPHRPAIIDLESGLAPNLQPGIWHATIGDQRVEVQVPLVPVIDDVGDRTEQITLASGDSAIVWYRTFEDEVAVRADLDQSGTEGCPSLDLTVTGGSEQANRDLAVDLADRLVLADH